jgi:hypothetical protein
VGVGLRPSAPALQRTLEGVGGRLNVVAGDVGERLMGKGFAEAKIILQHMPKIMERQ